MEFHTTDLALASVLVYFNIKLLRVDQYSVDNPRRKIFTFEDSPTLKEIYDKYWEKDLLVEPRAYHIAIKELKNRIHEFT